MTPHSWPCVVDSFPKQLLPKTILTESVNKITALACVYKQQLYLNKVNTLRQQHSFQQCKGTCIINYGEAQWMQMRTVQGLFSIQKTKTRSEAEKTCKAVYNLKSNRKRWGFGWEMLLLPCSLAGELNESQRTRLKQAATAFKSKLSTMFFIKTFFLFSFLSQLFIYNSLYTLHFIKGRQAFVGQKDLSAGSQELMSKFPWVSFKHTGK